MPARAWLVLAFLAWCSGCRKGEPPRPHSPEPSRSTATAAPEAKAESEPKEAAACSDSPEVTIFVSPRSPSAGEPLRAFLVTDRAESGSFHIEREGSSPVSSSERRGVVPAWWYAEIEAPTSGRYRIRFEDEGRTLACRDVEVLDAPKLRDASEPWPISAAWGRAMENLYSAWIEKLFDAPLDESPSWKALHDITRDRSRNFLYGYLGEDEDRSGPDAVSMVPDCADLPYYLRAYFAYKLELPFGYSDCSRGGPASPPRCNAWFSCAEMPSDEGKEPRVGFGRYLRREVANVVHSGTIRAGSGDDRNDFYDIPLTRESLRPGTVFADPYGHVLVVASLIPQTADAAGAMFAVDGQPDGTVARKRFWRGNFLFANAPSLGSPGFKRFRPVVSEGGALRRLSNGEIAKLADYADVSDEQRGLDTESFYDKMDDVLSPTPLDPMRALRETIQALDEQVRARIVSVENGRTRVRSLVEMPEGPSIFETSGAWEDFSTPSRDLRLLIAMDVARNFPARVKRRPERYAMGKEMSANDIERELARVLEEESKARKFRYTRSDGSPFELTLADVLSRIKAFEHAYNPNDCVELRWGAPSGSKERATCRKRAPQEQQQKMREYRPWFQERKRPSRM